MNFVAKPLLYCNIGQYVVYFGTFYFLQTRYWIDKKKKKGKFYRETYSIFIVKIAPKTFTNQFCSFIC